MDDLISQARYWLHVQSKSPLKNEMKNQQTNKFVVQILYFPLTYNVDAQIETRIVTFACRFFFALVKNFRFHLTSFFFALEIGPGAVSDNGYSTYVANQIWLRSNFN